MTLSETQDPTFEPWRSEVEHATSRSRRLATIVSPYEWAGKKHFVCLNPECQSGDEPVVHQDTPPPPWLIHQLIFYIVTLKTLKYFCISYGGCISFEINRNVLASSFCFIWIPMLWAHYKYVFSFSAETDFRRQILTSKVDPALKGFSWVNHLT